MKRLITGKRSRVSFIGIFVFAALVHLMAMPASSSQQVANLTEFTGMVIIQSRGDWGVKPEKGLPLYSMDKVVTRTGTAVVTFTDGAVIQIRANSNLLIEEQEKAGSVTRDLRLLLGKVLFKTGIGSKAQTNLQTPTAVVGLRGTAGTLSIGLDGKNYIQFTEGGASYTLGEFLSGVAKDVPPELAELNPAQRAAFAAAAAADQAKKAAEAAKDGTITEEQAAFAAAVAAEKAAMEALVAAETMLNNASPEIVQQAQAAINAANLAIKAAQEAQRELLNQGVQPPPETYTPIRDGETGFDVKPPSTITEITIPITITLPPTTLNHVKMSSRTPPGFLDSGAFSGSIDSTTGVGAIALEGQYTTLSPVATSPVGGSMTDGGAFEGYVGGVEGSWCGLFASIFVGGDRSAGFFTGSLSGGGMNGSLLATGPMYKELVGTATVTPANLYYAMNYDPMNPAFYDPAGYLLAGKAVPDFTSISVVNGSSLILGGAHGGADIPGITLTDGTMIGIWTYESPSGTYQNPGYESSSGKWGYNGGSYFMLGDLTLTDDGTGHVTVQGTANYMDPLYIGTIGVGYAGAYSSGFGQGYSAGTYTLRRLAFYGVSSSGSFYKQDQYGAVQATGDLPGILGGTHPLPLPGETSFTAMGAYDNPDGAEIFQQQYVGMSGSDYLFLFTAGRTENGMVQNGRVHGISAGPGGTYHLSGSVGGTYYEGAGMWEANGAIQSFANLTGDVVNGRIGGGSLGSAMTIDVTTRELISPADNPDWGIFFRSYEGTYQTPPPSSWNAKFGWSTSDPAYLLGDISGGALTGSAFIASLSNIVQITPQAIVHAEGTLFGGYGGTVWKGVGSGDWVREPLTFSSVLDYHALRMVPGVYYESDFGRTVSGGYDSYDYGYFVVDSGSLVFGYKEFDPYNGPSQEEVYLQSGHYITASDYPPYRVSTRYAAWTVGSLSQSYFTTLPSGEAWSREWYEQSAGYMSLGAGSISAIMGGTGNLWGSTSSSPASMILLGSYVPNDGNYTTPSVFRFNADSTVSTIGAYKGDVIGRIDDQGADGLFYAVYVDPNQKAGILKGDFSGTGTVYPEIGMWEASGSLYPTQMTSSVGFGPSTLADNMVGGVMFGTTNGHFGTSGSYIEGEGAGVTRSIKGQDWGTYRFGFTMDSEIQGLAGTWSARASGMGEFGTHPRLGQTGFIHDVGWWLSSPISGSALNDKIDASYSGKYLTYRQYGILSGDIIGTYDTTKNNWQGFSAGTWQKQQDLSFAAIVTGGNIKSEFKVYDGHYTGTGGSFYDYTYFEGLNGGRSHEYDASTNTTINTQYGGNGWKEQWVDANGAASYTESSWTGSLSDLLATGSTLFDSDEPILSYGPYYRLEGAGSIEGTIGGLGDPWSATAAAPSEIVILGEYDFHRSVTRSVFGFEFFSYNPYFSNINQQSRTVWNQATNTEYGAFRGYAGGTIINNLANPGSQDDIDGMLIGLYRDHLGNTGILMGGFVGKGYTELEGWETTSGAIYPIPLSTTTISAADFYGSAVESKSNYFPSDGFSTWGYNPSATDNKIHGTFRENRSLGIPGQSWSIAQVIGGGYYEGTPSDIWTGRYDFIDPGDNIRRVGTVDGTNWSGNNIEGKNSGAWVNYYNAATGVYGGEIKGTFNPDTLTYQTVTHITSLTANKFLEMINGGQTDALTKLNIPCIQVGTTNLQLMSVDSYFSAVNMNDVKFFAYSTGADPRIWATNSVSGSYFSTPAVNHTASLYSTGGASSLSAGFKVNNWSDGKWGASVSGSGSLSRTDVGGSTDIEFKGGTAGTYNPTARTFSGTGSGVAKKTAAAY